MRLKVVLKSGEGDKLKFPPVITVVNADTGERLDWVHAVSFAYEAPNPPMLKFEVYGFDAEIECPAEVAAIPTKGLEVDRSPFERSPHCHAVRPD